MVLRWAWILGVVVALALPVGAADIQVTCPPGLEVFLDGRHMGTCNAREDGLVLLDVAAGEHEIRIESEGFLPRTVHVRVASSPIEVEVAELYPAPVRDAVPSPVARETPGLTGSLVVTSAPQRCEVEIDGVIHAKGEVELRLDGLAPGRHTITFRKDGFENISRAVTVLAGAAVSVRGNLLGGEVEVVHEGKGSLRVFSKPQRCTVRVLDRVAEKTGSRLNLSGLPAGEHPLVVSIPGRDLVTNVVIVDEMRTILEVSFLPGEEPFVVSHVPE